jgi:heme O synthase-like polyprenyltransferase
MSLVIFTGFCGLWIAPGHIHPILGFTAILCIAGGAGAAGCLNMWYERDIDKRMIRTMARPTASGLIHPVSIWCYTKRTVGHGLPSSGEHNSCSVACAYYWILCWGLHCSFKT